MDEKVSKGLTQFGDMVMHFKGQGFSFEEAVRLTSEVQELFMKQQKMATEALGELADTMAKIKNLPKQEEGPPQGG